MKLNLSQRFSLARAKYEVKRFKRAELEKLCVQLLHRRMLLQNSVRSTLLDQGIVIEMDVNGSDGPEFMSEGTFMDLLKLQLDEPDLIPVDIDDEGWEELDEEIGYEGEDY
jgi:hypothetical protein